MKPIAINPVLLCRFFLSVALQFYAHFSPTKVDIIYNGLKQSLLTSRSSPCSYRSSNLLSPSEGQIFSLLFHRSIVEKLFQACRRQEAVDFMIAPVHCSLVECGDRENIGGEKTAASDRVSVAERLRNPASREEFPVILILESSPNDDHEEELTRRRKTREVSLVRERERRQVLQRMRRAAYVD